MTRLILHVGPPKCGSSSIQHFFATQKKPCVENMRYAMLDSLEVSELNYEKPSASILTTFTQLLANNLIGCDVLILSNASLFQCPYAIKNICSLAKSLVTKISIIGYSRRQSEFLISAYSQWSFRSPDLIKDATDVLDQLELDPVLFSGLEKQLIASIVNDFYDPKLPGYRIIDWHNSYKDIAQLVDKSGAVIKCGVLPKKGTDLSLIQDFCEKAGLTLLDDMQDASRQVINVSFNPAIIEAINNAVVFGLDMPGPHESNQILELLSSKMIQMKNNSSEFLSDLKSYIDAYFSNSNLLFCQEYGLSEIYFSQPGRFSKEEILDIIIQEGQQRALNKSIVINNYRMLSARMIELCLRLTKGS